MDTGKIKTYAIQARRDFLKAVTERANSYGIFSDEEISPAEFKGDLAIIGERAFPKKEGELRQKLVNRIQKEGFEMVMRASAYTWFNRFVALRYMELHGYIDHGWGVLSANGGAAVPEILEHAAEMEFQGLDKEKVIELRLAGDKDNELYRLLLLAQCHALHQAMPFLFDRIDSETELLLPDNLLHSDSPIRKLVTQLDDDLWENVEILGWLYQFYISEKKDEVIGKVVKSEDIPAATQLFTPNWIVKYMVHNTLGRLWLTANPDSPLKGKMAYYIEPAPQTPEVQRQLEAAAPGALNPEEITFFDPACGSGHILVEAYDLFREIYLERGYRTRDIPRLILEKNLYGLDICDRAAQLTGFALLMKARQDDRRILSRNRPALNIMAIEESDAADLKAIEIFFQKDAVIQEDLKALVGLYENAKTFGSLIAVPQKLQGKRALFEGALEKHVDGLFRLENEDRFKASLKQTEILARQYDCVVTNPPYMGSKSFNSELKDFVNDYYNSAKGDLYGCFILKNIDFCKSSGFIGMITIPNWMFLSSFENLRNELLEKISILSLVHNGRGVWGSDFGSCSFTLYNYPVDGYSGTFKRLFRKQGSVAHVDELEKRFLKNKEYYSTGLNFKKIPGSPIAYWASERILKEFESSKNLKQIVDAAQGMKTLDNERFVREWAEVSLLKLAINGSSLSQKKWFPINHGGEYRKWYGNNESVINWENDGHELKLLAKKKYNSITRTITGMKHYFNEGMTWTAISSSKFSVRRFPAGFLFTNAGMCAFGESTKLDWLCSLLNTKVAFSILSFLSPTLNFGPNQIKLLPIKEESAVDRSVPGLFHKLLKKHKNDWDSYETSWDFNIPLCISNDHHLTTIIGTYDRLRSHWNETVQETQRLEEENNRIFIEAYNLQDELTPEVSLSEITLTCNPHYRYKGNKSEYELETLLRADTIKELISYAIGCMMGRYSLDHPGLIYAHSGNVGFDASKYHTFAADEDGIIPIMDQAWFDDDAVNRFEEFLKVAWPPENLDENLTFVAENLTPKQNEAPIETIRRYLSAQFFKDHLKTYKKRPIYWLFSSGRLKAFECLVYLHRYNESTLSRMRSAYVTPLQGNFSARMEYLQNERDAAATASAKKKLQKEMDLLKKKQAELSAFDDELRHYADRKIALDLDDGVKVNYGKFGNLLVEKKAITGKK